MQFIYDSEEPVGKRITFINRGGNVLAENFWRLSVEIGEAGNDSVQLGAWKDGQKIIVTWDIGKQ